MSTGYTLHKIFISAILSEPFRALDKKQKNKLTNKIEGSKIQNQTFSHKGGFLCY